MDKYIGRLLDNRYEILEVLGSGGMAVVYKARCHRLNRLVAIKILKDDNLQDEDFRRRFHAESQAVAMLSHPNIVSVYDVSTSVMADYIVMELIEGITLKQYMEKKGVLNWKETLHFAIQIAKALEHAHSRGIVHRDIKPHNVMVLKNGSVKVTDFGIARMMSKGNTLTKEALGSVHYISPEQAKGGRVDSRSDIYSLGAVMYEMMAGRPPYDGDSPVSVAIQHINGGAIMPSILNPNIPGGLEQIIMKAMAHEVENRYASAAQMLADMDEFRKDPTILFDYNAPSLDAVIHLTKPPVEEQPKTVAEQKAGAQNGQRRRTPAAGGKSTGRSTGSKPAGKKPAGNTAARSVEKKKKERVQPVQQQDWDEEEGRSRAATIAIIACSLAAVVAIVIFLGFLLGGGMTYDTLVEVPKLIGENFDELQEYKDLKIIPDRVYNEVCKEGVIFEQSVPAGEKVVKDTKIVVKVSLGPTPEKVYMSNVTDLPEDQAKKILEDLDMNLNIRTETETSETVTAGNVIRTEPKMNTQLTAGQTVTLVISGGPEFKKGYMPPLVGSKQDVAKNILEGQKLHLEIIIEEVFDSEIAPGYVIRTDPMEDEEISTGGKVTLYVSKGPELKVVPPVAGMKVDTAMSTVMTAGFKMPQIEMVNSDKPEGTVISQSAEAYTELDVQTTIILQVSNGLGVITEVTKDVELSLQGRTALIACLVRVERNGTEVFNQIVPQGTEYVILPGQTGSGEVVYTVYINGVESWQETVVF